MKSDSAVVSMLRGVNLGPNKRMAMDALRAMYESLGLRNPQTYIQSGNVVFLSRESDLARLARKIEKKIIESFGFESAVYLRTATEMESVLARNPFSAECDSDPARVVVTFLRDEPGAAARDKLLLIDAVPDRFHLDGRELYVHFPDGMGRSKLPALLARAVGDGGTARNWNTVRKLHDMAKGLETGIP